jgi:hypothetical protein
MRIIIEIMNPGPKPQLMGMPLEVDMDTYNTILNLIDEDSPTSQERVCKLIVKHSIDHKEELANLLDQIEDHRTQMNILIPVSINASTMVISYQRFLGEVIKENISKSLNGLSEEQKVEILNRLLEDIAISEH